MWAHSEPISAYFGLFLSSKVEKYPCGCPKNFSKIWRNLGDFGEFPSSFRNHFGNFTTPVGRQKGHFVQTWAHFEPILAYFLALRWKKCPCGCPKSFSKIWLNLRKFKKFSNFFRNHFGTPTTPRSYQKVHFVEIWAHFGPILAYFWALRWKIARVAAPGAFLNSD